MIDEKHPIKDKGVFSIDISAKLEKLIIDESTGNIKLYVRFIHNIMPNNPQEETKAGNLNIGDAEPIGETYLVRIAKAPRKESLSYGEIIQLNFGQFTLQPVNKLSSGFNEIDQFGNGSFEFLAEITVRPREEIPDEESAKDYISDLCYENKIGFNYSITIEQGRGRQLYKSIEIKIPEKLIKSNKEFLISTAEL
ncbi:MAG: hypothetical protein N2440_05905 [Actinobacteria bacterium]|nr:hypothetical protein [Actinomycetota bacterium]